MAMFGWCLKDMSIAQHSQCIHEFEYATPIVCQCLCHTDFDAFVVSKTTQPVIKPKKGKKK